MANLFKSAAPIASAKPAAVSSKLEVPLDGLKELAQVDALMKALSAIQETLAAGLKDEAFDKFMTLASNGVRPASFRGVDDGASASVEMRKRGTNSALGTEEQMLLAKYNVPTFKRVVTPHLYGINPKYAADDKMLAKVSKALEKIVPEDFIVEQLEQSSQVVDDATMVAVFKEGVPAEVVRMCTTMAIKPKLDSTDINEVLTAVTALLAPAPEEAPASVKAKKVTAKA